MGSGVGDGCTVQIVNMMRGGGKHRNKKNGAENKPTTSPKSQEPVRGPQEHEVIRLVVGLFLFWLGSRIDRFVSVHVHTRCEQVMGRIWPTTE